MMDNPMETGWMGKRLHPEHHLVERENPKPSQKRPKFKSKMKMKEAQMTQRMMKTAERKKTEIQKARATKI